MFALTKIFAKKTGNMYLVLLIFLATMWLQYQDFNEVIVGWTNIRSVKTQFLFLGGKEFFPTISSNLKGY